jgi:hypothetical protein
MKYIPQLLTDMIVSSNTGLEHLHVVIGDHKDFANNRSDDLTKRNFIFGKKVKEEDYYPVVKRNNWTSGTVYNNYKNKDNNDFHVINSSRQVYLCISNNNGVESTVQPTGVSNTPFQTSDGYVWKYMFTVTSADLLKFATDEYIPVKNNANVVSNTVSGSIDHIDVVDGGSNFLAYNTGTIKQVISNRILKLDDSASNTADYYNGSSFNVTNGTGLGLIRSIDNHFANTTGKYIEFSSNVSVSTDSEYIIGPKVTISDREGTGFEGYTTVNSNNEIDEIVVANTGSGYINPSITITTANNTGANTAFDIKNAPRSGHGVNVSQELNSNTSVIVVEFANTVSDLLPNDLDYYSTHLVYGANTDSSQQNTANYGILLGVSNTYSVDDHITGGTSNATAYVYYSNSTHIAVNDTVGTFSNGETITNESNVSSTINIIQDSDVEVSSGTILYSVKHENGIDRSLYTLESFKLILNGQDDN